MERLAKELEFVKSLAREGSRIALERAAAATPVEKQNRSYVTATDLELERLFRERLGDAYPDDVLTGEEMSRGGGTGARRWVIDPIDGTGNYVHGLPLWAISIGLLDSGEPVLGVIAVPPLNEIYWAVKGGGAWRDGERVQCRDADSFHPQDNVSLSTNALRVVDTRTVPGRLRDIGSACCEQVFLAANRLSACIFCGEQAHDVAAGIVITSEAGCAFGTIEGKRLTPAEFIASAPVRVPTIIAPPKRLESLMASARRLPPLPA